jgi:SOS response regulatory protein OraA/RecX
VRPDAAEATVATLTGAGFVDDQRLARGRALALAERGWGDAAIEARLAGDGLPEPLVRQAIAELESEARRAAGLVRGLRPQKAWTLLQRRGFELEAIETVLGALDESAAEGLG